MARYDRIARLECPDRDVVFPAWMTLRDLDGREREAELGRRARLRFLALRPVHRLLRHRDDQVDDHSFQQQLDTALHELGQLPTEDPERSRLVPYLLSIGKREPADMVAATLAVGAAIEFTGQPFAAEEFYRSALELAERYDHTPLELRPLLELGRLLRDRQRWSEAAGVLTDAAGRAARIRQDVEWAHARLLLATTHARRGDTEAARRDLDEVSDRPVVGRSDRIRALAAAVRCEIELAAGNADAALEAGAIALDSLPEDDEARSEVLLDMAAAFRTLGFHPAAVACYAIVSRSAARADVREAATALRNELQAGPEPRAAPETPPPADSTRRIAERVETLDRITASNAG